MTPPTLTVSTVAEVVPTVHKHGVAIWRGFVPTAVTEQFAPHVLDNLRNFRAYASRKFGVLKMDVLPPDLRRECITPNVRRVFDLALGPHDITIQEIYIRVPGYYQPHIWHQDANAGNQEYHFMCWIALTDCGLSAPGLSFAIGNPGRYVAERFDLRDVIDPVFAPGDAFFFDAFSVHKTNINPDMNMSRIAYKLGAKSVGMEP